MGSSMNRADPAPIDPHAISITREISRSPSSTIFEVSLDGRHYTMKVVRVPDQEFPFMTMLLTSQKFHDNGDPGFSKRGRDLNRFRCEFQRLSEPPSLRRLRARLRAPVYYGCIDRLDPTLPQFQPHTWTTSATTSTNRGRSCSNTYPTRRN